jgi:hypothetical protein
MRTDTLKSSVSPISTQSSSRQAAHLRIISARVSHALSGAPVAATCGPVMPAQGASYVVVTNDGTAANTIKGITFSYVEMMSRSGAPTGACVVGAGATEYITLTGVGEDPATAGEPFSILLNSSSGELANFQGAFG